MNEVIEERREATEALRKIPISNPQERYDLEYCTPAEITALTGISCKFLKGNTHYWYWSPGATSRELECRVNRTHRVLDVGAGNGMLLRTLISSPPMFVPRNQITGVDISETSVKRLRELGVNAIHGTLADVKGEYDRIFLSYFIDRDSDQLGTIEKAVKLLSPKRGEIYLEGLFPCKLEDSLGTSYGKANVTKGNSRDEDVELVIKAFECFGATMEYTAHSNRYVYSLDGWERLSSTTICFKRM